MTVHFEFSTVDSVLYLFIFFIVTETICSLQLNLDRLLARMWDEMGLVRVYTKPQGQQPDFTDPVVLSTVRSLPFPRLLFTLAFPRNRGNRLADTRVVYHQDRGGCTVEDFCNHIHRSLLKDVKYVLVWGISARHYPQHCGLSHGLQDEDVVQIVKKKVMICPCLIWSHLEAIHKYREIITLKVSCEGAKTC